MARDHRAQACSPTPAIIVFAVSTCLLILLAVNPFMRTNPTENQKHVDGQKADAFTYLDDDFPPSWQIGPLDTVHMPFENTVHYGIDDPLGDAEWRSLLPAGQGLLHLGPHQRPFTISMFHQLDCLNTIREAAVFEISRIGTPQPEVEEQPPRVQECMDYIRHMVLCRAELRLENVKQWGPGTKHTTAPETTHSCKDWRVAYETAEENFAAFTSLHGSSESL